MNKKKAMKQYMGIRDAYLEIRKGNAVTYPCLKGYLKLKGDVLMLHPYRKNSCPDWWIYELDFTGVDVHGFSNWIGKSFRLLSEHADRDLVHSYDWKIEHHILLKKIKHTIHGFIWDMKLRRDSKTLMIGFDWAGMVKQNEI